LLALLSLLALDRQRVTGQRDINVVLGHAGHLGADLERAFLLGDVNGRGWKAKRGVEPGEERRYTETTGEIIEQSVHLGSQRAPDVGSVCQSRCGLLHR